MAASLEAAAEYFLQPATRPPLARRNHEPHVHRSLNESSVRMNQRITKRIFGGEESDHSLLRPGQPYKEKPGSITEASLVLLMERKKRLEQRQRQQDLEEILFEINRQAVESESIAKQCQRTAGLPLPTGNHDKLRMSAYACLVGAHQLPDGHREDDDEIMPLPSRGIATSTSYSSDYQLLSTSSTYPLRRTASALSSVKGETPRMDQATSRGAGITRRSSSHSTFVGGYDIGSRGGSGGIGSMEEDPDGYQSYEAPFPITDWHGEMPLPLVVSNDPQPMLDPVAVHLQQRELDWNTSVVPDKPIADIYKKKHNEQQPVVVPGQEVSVQLPHVEEVLRAIRTHGIAAAEPRTATTQTVCALFTYGQPLQRSERLSVVAPILSRVTQPPKPKSYRAILEEKIAAGEIDLENEEVRKVVSTLFEPEHVSQPVRKKVHRSQPRACRGLPGRSASAPLTTDDPVLEDTRASSLSPIDTPPDARAQTPVSRSSTPAKVHEQFSRRVQGASPLRRGDPDRTLQAPRGQSKRANIPLAHQDRTPLLHASVDTEDYGNTTSVVGTIPAHANDSSVAAQCDPKDQEEIAVVRNASVTEPGETVGTAVPRTECACAALPHVAAGPTKPTASSVMKPLAGKVASRPGRTPVQASTAAAPVVAPKKLATSNPTRGTRSQTKAAANLGTTIKSVTVALDRHPPDSCLQQVVTPPCVSPAQQESPTHASGIVSGPSERVESETHSCSSVVGLGTTVLQAPCDRTPREECDAPSQHSNVDCENGCGGYDDDEFEDASSPSPPRQSAPTGVESSPRPLASLEPELPEPETYEDEDDTFEEHEEEREAPQEEQVTPMDVAHQSAPHDSIPTTPAVGELRQPSLAPSSDEAGVAPEEDYDDDEFVEPSPSGKAEKMFEDIGGPGDEYSSDEEETPEVVEAQQQPSTSESSLSIQQSHGSMHAHVPAPAPPGDASEGDTYANALSVALRQRMKGKVSPRGASTAVVLSPPPEIYEGLSGVTSRSVSAEPQQRPDSKHRRFSRGSTGGGDARPQYTARDFFANNDDEASRGRTAIMAESDDLSLMLPAQMRPTSRASTDNKSRTPPLLTPTASDGTYDWSRTSPPPEDVPNGEASMNQRESKKDRSKRKKSKDSDLGGTNAPAVVLDGFEEIDVGMPLKKGSGKRKKEKKPVLNEGIANESSTPQAPRENRSNRRSSNLGIALDL